MGLSMLADEYKLIVPFAIQPQSGANRFHNKFFPIEKLFVPLVSSGAGLTELKSPKAASPGRYKQP